MDRNTVDVSTAENYMNTTQTNVDVWLGYYFRIKELLVNVYAHSFSLLNLSELF